MCKLKQIGNLAVACAHRRDVKMEVFDHGVIVRIWQPPREVTHYFPWDADNAISQLVYELNHGNYAIKVNYRTHNENARKSEDRCKKTEALTLTEYCMPVSCKDRIGPIFFKS